MIDATALGTGAITTAATPVVVSSAPSLQASARAIDGGLLAPPACPPRRSIRPPIAPRAPPAPPPATARARSRRARFAARGSVAVSWPLSEPWAAGCHGNVTGVQTAISAPSLRNDRRRYDLRAKRCSRLSRQSGCCKRRVRIAPERQAIFFRRRHQPSRPPLAKIRPGRPAPAMGPGTPLGIAE
jgi:hypothetical protein